MSKLRFFQPEGLKPGDQLQLTSDNSIKIIKVLRMTIGDEIIIFNNTNYEYTAKISDIIKKNVVITIISETENNLESPAKIHLGQAIAKSSKMDLVIQKAVELGVHEISPLIAHRNIVKISPKQTNDKISHWQKIAIHACCQSGRNTVPKINPISELTPWLSQQEHNNYKFILSPHAANKFTLSPAKQNCTIALIIGPEGGFTELEVKQANAKQFKSISLGNRTLRTETTSLAAISILQAWYGDLL